MFQPIQITKVLQDPKHIQEEVKEGKTFTVFSRSVPVFNIVPTDFEGQRTKRQIPMPQLTPIGLPNVIKTKDFYEKYAE